jgi:hypothetical protein
MSGAMIDKGDGVLVVVACKTVGSVICGDYRKLNYAGLGGFKPHD